MYVCMYVCVYIYICEICIYRCMYVCMYLATTTATITAPSLCRINITNNVLDITVSKFISCVKQYANQKLSKFGCFSTGLSSNYRKLLCSTQNSSSLIYCFIAKPGKFHNANDFHKHGCSYLWKWIWHIERKGLCRDVPRPFLLQWGRGVRKHLDEYD